ncbi:MAG: VanW family protein [Coriobacteriales bacterium]
MAPKKTSSPANTLYELSRYTWDKNRAVENSSEFFSPGEAVPASMHKSGSEKVVKKRKVEKPAEVDGANSKTSGGSPKAAPKKAKSSKKGQSKSPKQKEPKPSKGQAAKPAAPKDAPAIGKGGQDAPARQRVESKARRPKRTPAPGSSKVPVKVGGEKDGSRFGMKSSKRSGVDAMAQAGANGKRRRKKQGGQPAGAPTGAPAKKPGRARYIILAIVAILVVFYAVDTVTQVGKIHRGVSVAGVNVGGMTVEDAARAIEAGYNVAINGSDITMYADEEARESGAEPTVISFDYESLESYNENPPAGPVFQISPATLGATIDGTALAEEAYHVGRGADFLLGRLKASTVGTKLDLKIEVQGGSLNALTSILTDSLGTPMVNPGIRFDNGTFTTTPGNDGYMVKTEEFNKLIKEALLSDNRSFVIPMGERKMEVKEKAATQAAETAQQALSEPITLVYGDKTWSLDASVLGPLVKTYVNKGSLVPYVSLPKVEKAIPELEGMGDVGQPAQDVKFSYDGESISYVEATTGMSPDYEFITKRLNKIAFGNESLSEDAGEKSTTILEDEEAPADTSADDAARRVVMTLTTSYPQFTYEDAQKLGLNDSMIASYTTEFDGASENKATNIKLLADLLTNTVIPPGQTFSINETAGECNEEKGFQEAGSILNGSVTSEIGGGICQVATTIFNAVYEAGYPIVERHNHSNHMASYPDGLDASISWPYMDLKFKNDTENYLLLLVDYTDSTLTCSLWGIDPGYEVEMETVDWQEGGKATERTETDPELPEGYEEIKSYGKDGHSIVIERKVYDASGDLHSEDTLESVYQPSATVTVVGTG